MEKLVETIEKPLENKENRLENANDDDHDTINSQLANTETKDASKRNDSVSQEQEPRSADQ